VLLFTVTPAVQREGIPLADPILQQPRLYLDRSTETKIVSIASILAEKVWLVPVEEDPQEDGLLRFDRDASSAEGASYICICTMDDSLLVIRRHRNQRKIGRKPEVC
jgi:hypothetical protein